ncbi:hypothetical protein K501DRAFT_312353 [Backusella circina FSU 941]|nr:hypothetical protein K501DRAFT_312353 [Backusella circina FSU 941]
MPRITRITPIATYALAIILVLWVLLGAITLPNAGRWFKGSGYKIENDVIRLSLINKPSINHSQNLIYENTVYDKSVFPIDNTPEVPSDGLRGILYDSGDSCNHKIKRTPLPSIIKKYNITKIALIKQTGNCFLAQKILNAQLEGASGVVIYHNASSIGENTPIRLYDMSTSPKAILIPAYVVDLFTGMELLGQLRNLSHQPNATKHGYTQLFSHITLYPTHRPALDHWQFALVIIGIMLITSVLVISAMQCHLWQKRRSTSFSNSETLSLSEHQQIALDEQFWRTIMGQRSNAYNSNGRRCRRKLDQSIVDLLPTRIYEDMHTINISKTDEKETPDYVENRSIESSGLTSCVICLDSFEPGNILRVLPCNHEYHKNCIDTWLTGKNATCPLCLQCVEIPSIPNEAYTSCNIRSKMAQARTCESMPGLAETWPSVNRNQQIIIRQNASLVSIGNQPNGFNLHDEEIRRYDELPESTLASVMMNEEVTFHHPTA